VTGEHARLSAVCVSLIDFALLGLIMDMGCTYWVRVYVMYVLIPI
jgi:hypothetical protein